MIQESKSKRYTSYTGLTEYEAFAFIITWLWDCSDARGDKHANRLPSKEDMRNVTKFTVRWFLDLVQLGICMRGVNAGV